MIRIGVVMLLGVLSIVYLQGTGVPIHPAVQRALSFIPGPWDRAVVEGARDSSEWRFEMWKIALQSDKYIKDKLLGDGFGFSAYELQLQIQSALGGQGYLGESRAEAQLVTGAYHSGPISAIRYVGAVGLVLFVIFLMACARYAWKLIVSSKGTPFFPVALFVGVPLIYKPIAYVFVFGAFEGDLPDAIVGLAFLNLIARGLAAYQSSLNPAQDSLGKTHQPWRPTLPPPEPLRA